MEAGRSEPDARLVCTAPATPRLADVVCRVERRATEPLVCGIGRLSAAKQTGCDSIIGTESLSGERAGLPSRAFLSLPVRYLGGTPADWRLVAPRETRRLHADRFARSAFTKRRLPKPPNS